MPLKKKKKNFLIFEIFYVTTHESSLNTWVTKIKEIQTTRKFQI